MLEPLEPGVNEMGGSNGVEIINVSLERIEEFCRVFGRDWWNLFSFFGNFKDIVVVE